MKKYNFEKKKEKDIECIYFNFGTKNVFLDRSIPTQKSKLLTNMYRDNVLSNNNNKNSVRANLWDVIAENNVQVHSLKCLPLSFLYQVIFPVSIWMLDMMKVFVIVLIKQQ